MRAGTHGCEWRALSTARVTRGVRAQNGADREHLPPDARQVDAVTLRSDWLWRRAGA
jgi:hypothetical protein